MSDPIFSIQDKRTEIPSLGSVFYEQSGHGSVCIVLLHGFPFDRRLWYKLLPELQAYHLLVPDMPGVGNSLLQKADMSMDDYADCVKAMLDAEGVEQCILLGHSMGGYIALAFAEKYASSLLGLGLLHSTAYADDAERRKKREQVKKFILEEGAARFARSFIPGPFAPGYHNEPELNKLIKWSEECSSEGLIAATGAMQNRPDRSAVIQQLNVPLLITCGSKDPVFPYTQSLTLSTQASCCMIELWEECGHMGMIENSQAMAGAIRNFTALCGGRAGRN